MAAEPQKSTATAPAAEPKLKPAGDAQYVPGKGLQKDAGTPPKKGEVEYGLAKDDDVPLAETTTFGHGKNDKKAGGGATTQPKEKTLEASAVEKFTAVLEKLGLPKEGARVGQAFDLFESTGVADAGEIDAATGFRIDTGRVNKGKDAEAPAPKKEAPVKYEITLPKTVPGKRMLEVLEAFGLDKETIQGTKTSRGLTIKRNAEKWTIAKAEMDKLVEAYAKHKAGKVSDVLAIVKQVREDVAREGFEKVTITKLPDNTFIVDNIGKDVDSEVALFKGAAIAKKETGTEAGTQKWTLPVDTLRKLAIDYFKATIMADSKLQAEAVQYVKGSITREGLEGITVTPAGENFVLSGVIAGTNPDVIHEGFQLVGKPAPDGDWVFELKKDRLENAVKKPLNPEAETEAAASEEGGIGLAGDTPQADGKAVVIVPEKRKLSPAEAAVKAAIDKAARSDKTDVVLADGEYTITLPEGFKAEQVLANLGVDPAVAAAVKPYQKYEKWVFHSMPLLAKALAGAMTDPMLEDQAAAAAQNRTRVAELLKNPASITKNADEIASLLTTGIQGSLPGLGDAKLGFEKDGLVALRQVAPGTPPTVSFFDKADLYERATGPDGKPLVTPPTPVMEDGKPKMVKGEPVMQGGGEPIFKTVPVFEKGPDGKPTDKKIGEEEVRKTAKDGKPLIEIKRSGPLVITIAQKDMPKAAQVVPGTVKAAAAKPAGELKAGTWLRDIIFPGVKLEKLDQSDGKVSMIVNLPKDKVEAALQAADISVETDAVKTRPDTTTDLTIPETEFTRAFKVAKAEAAKAAGNGGPAAGAAKA